MQRLFQFLDINQNPYTDLLLVYSEGTLRSVVFDWDWRNLHQHASICLSLIYEITEGVGLHNIFGRTTPFLLLMTGQVHRKLT